MNIERYRAAEQRLWSNAGITPDERRIRLSKLNVEARVMEVGSGIPTLFIHGSPSAGSAWAELAACLPERRSLVLDRPGCGLSDPYPLTVSTLPDFAATLVASTLDALNIERADIVASSFGGYIALRAAAVHPDRVGRMVLLGCPALAPGVALPGFMKMMLFPGMSRLIPAMPARESDLRRTFRQMGHDAGRVSREFTDWYLSLQRDTPTMRHELAMLAAIGNWRGIDPSLTLTPELLSRVTSPTHFYWGEDDTFGGADVARNLVSLLPDATLELVPDSGHLPWVDDPAAAARAVTAHIGAGADLPSAEIREGQLVAG